MSLAFESCLCVVCLHVLRVAFASMSDDGAPAACSGSRAHRRTQEERRARFSGASSGSGRGAVRNSGTSLLGDLDDDDEAEAARNPAFANQMGMALIATGSGQGAYAVLRLPLARVSTLLIVLCCFCCIHTR